MTVLLFVAVVIRRLEVRQGFRLPVRTIFRDGGFKLADLLADRLQLQFKSGVNVDVVVDLVGGLGAGEEANGVASGGKAPDGGASLWGSGFLPTVYQGAVMRDSSSVYHCKT